VERLYGIDTSTMSIVFTSGSTGSLVGAILCGLIYEHVNRELAFTIGCLVEGLTFILAPFIGRIGGFTAFFAAIGTQAATQGFIDSSLLR
jgi:dipeptide/tripeptide permease